MAWLEAPVWPEQTDRLASAGPNKTAARRLRAAIMIAAEQKPRLVKGDLRTDLAALTRDAPTDATLVIFHTLDTLYPRRRFTHPRIGAATSVAANAAGAAR